MANQDSTGNNLSVNKTAQLQSAISQIAYLAHNAKQITAQSFEHIGFNEELSTKLASNQLMVENIGIIADMCSGILGGGQMLGGAENWILSPIFHHHAALAAKEAA